MTANNDFRSGTIVKPQQRISAEQIEIIHRSSMAILDDPGVICFNEEAADLFAASGCPVKKQEGLQQSWQVRIPERVIGQAIESVPTEVVLGARNPQNRLKMHPFRAIGLDRSGRWPRAGTVQPRRSRASHSRCTPSKGAVLPVTASRTCWQLVTACSVTSSG